MNKVFIYWDNSNIFIGARALTEEREGYDAQFRSRIHFHNLLELARAGRPVEKALAASSVPPELRALWNRMEAEGIEVKLFDRGESWRGEQEWPDQALQTQMLRDLADYNGDPGIAVLLTGDGKGFYDGVGFHADIERMHRRGWCVEVLSWGQSCNQRMRKWAEENGIFIPLDDYYESITYLEPSIPGYPTVESRPPKELDLSRRPVAE